MQTCYNCGTENQDIEKFCHRCGATLGRLSELQETAMSAGIGPERLLWEEGDIQLTTEAILIGMNTDAPDVVPLETIQSVRVEDTCLVISLKYGDDKQCFLKDPSKLAALIEDQVMRPRLAHQRKASGAQQAE
jgi:hypothetical protein